ncbi:MULTISPECIES: DUF4344 domain-containing metallopeptidase [unclassified Streptomyces]|uniref:DUF4344 domain-containing metallopeptidase n=1 Tax=unclassified Streptomyces TaxID=2593676 RepID=UPI001BE94D14|nr:MULTISPECIES: DUF4344 domain-containing metallopeptidase [unclassified Streptomyces]MBT2408059.1 hypothetical protein [Streptomyces sp. ISL-21]MBT2458861.1 hypothetical protein [Streptomyces sp. ISL-86]MBT2611409.1 hypothetical protein [Streptomyces sp. ISL-87]
MGASHRTRPSTAALLALMALLSTTTGCEQQPPARGFAVRYEDPDPADAADARLLRDRQVAETATEALNAYLSLPRQVTVLARSCAGEGSGYDPGTREIELCYDDLAEQRELFESAGHHPADEEAAAVLTETVYHEAGHALIDALHLPVDGDRAEEDAADGFAALMLIRQGPTGERTLRTAAQAYDLAAATDPDPAPDADEHAPPAARAAAHLCRLHTASPTRHPDLAPRTHACTPTWPQTRDPWTRDLAPFLRR